MQDTKNDLSWAGRVLTAFADPFIPGVHSRGTGQIAISSACSRSTSRFLWAWLHLRHSTGSRLWRALHRFIIVVSVLSAWHTLLAGSNVGYDGAFRTLVWALRIPLAALLLLRLLTPASANGCDFERQAGGPVRSP